MEIEEVVIEVDVDRDTDLITFISELDKLGFKIDKKGKSNFGFFVITGSASELVLVTLEKHESVMKVWDMEEWYEFGNYFIEELA